MSGKDATGLIIGGEPRIDFLPPEVKAGKQARRTRRSLIALVLVVVAACVGGYVFATSLALQSQAQLAEEQARTQQLLSEQTEFAEVRTVSGMVAAAKNARLVGSASEIEWRSYLSALQKALPEGVTIDTFSIDSQSALESAPVPSVPLQQPRVATINLTALAPSLPRIDALLVNFKDLTGYADATATTIALEEGVYTVSVVLNVNADAFERRYFETPPPADTAAEPTEGEG